MSKRNKLDLLTYRALDNAYFDLGTWESPENPSGVGVPAWSVAPAYAVRNGKLEEVWESEGDEYPAPSIEYNPFARTDLPSSLARISSGEITSAEFASRFGLLGYAHLFRAEKRNPALGYDHGVEGGDPVEWIGAHSNTVDLCLELLGQLQEPDGPDEETIRYDLEAAKAKPFALGMLLPIGVLPIEDVLLRLHRAAKSREFSWITPSVEAQMIVAQLVSENIKGIHRRVVLPWPRGSRRMSTTFTYNAMVEVAYWHLANQIDGGGIRKCLECGRYFVSRDKRQQYCPALPGSTRSRCSSRLNVAAKRDRDKAREEK